MSGETTVCVMIEMERLCVDLNKRAWETDRWKKNWDFVCMFLAVNQYANEAWSVILLQLISLNPSSPGLGTAHTQTCLTEHSTQTALAHWFPLSNSIKVQSDHLIKSDFDRKGKDFNRSTGMPAISSVACEHRLFSLLCLNHRKTVFFSLPWFLTVL